MNGENINLTKGGGDGIDFNIPNDVYSKNELVENQLDYEPFGGSEKAEKNYDFQKSETAKESAEADRRIEIFRQAARLKGQKVFRAIRLEDSLGRRS